MTADRPSIATDAKAGRSAYNYVCWSRMQAEAGQPLEIIVKRKETERRLGGGLFCWGVGNAPASAISALARMGTPVSAIFSIMKSKPKSIDAKPGRVVAWRRYFDSEGVLRPLPAHVLVTSRGDSATGPKQKHFALMCWSDQPLTLQTGLPFDPSAYRNVGGRGAPVGASQVTALLRQSSKPSNETAYEVNLRAQLAGGYWVRLADPIELNSPDQERLAQEDLDDDAWLDLLDRLRSPAKQSFREPEDTRYLI
ncbi:hypothetical protein [Mesorhizobium captivum]|uniref:hypothetical protein n=1 Tax=Mesorhizobium captivum TaxID=3072319 RepID=UPI002A247A87|nr:hypothetical protein [Mesorhizobium sp. VK3C]MDX8449628.1 hypothetical protein [Mesorhizobium sp. VK3C]